MAPVSFRNGAWAIGEGMPCNRKDGFLAAGGRMKNPAGDRFPWQQEIGFLGSRR